MIIDTRYHHHHRPHPLSRTTHHPSSIPRFSHWDADIWNIRPLKGKNIAANCHSSYPSSEPPKSFGMTQTFPSWLPPPQKKTNFVPIAVRPDLGKRTRFWVVVMTIPVVSGRWEFLGKFLALWIWLIPVNHKGHMEVSWLVWTHGKYEYPCC